MFQELKFQLSTAILIILTVAAGASAVINFGEQNRYRLPEDGVVWVDRAGGVEALYVPSGSAGAKAGIHPGDRLTKIDTVPIKKAVDVMQVIARLGAWSKADYLVTRGVVVVPIKGLIINEVPLDRAVMYQYLVGAAYLLIGLFVYFRRGTAHKAQHFYILCLASFIFLSFHYTGKLNPFDKVIYFGNVAAGLLAPTLFLHFCLTFPEPRRWFARNTRVVWLYVPAALLFLTYLGFSSGALSVRIPLVELRWMLDRVWMLFSTVPYLIGGAVLSREYHRAEDPIVRQQLKWLRNGAFCGILPFALLYVLPYAMGAVPSSYQKMSVLSLALIPLCLSYAIVRYRLMDVDIIFRRGVAYTLATVCVFAAFYGIIFALGIMVQKNFKDLGQISVMTVMLVTAFLFQPIRNRIQEWLHKHFYRDSYEYRRTLVEFPPSCRVKSISTPCSPRLASASSRLSTSSTWPSSSRKIFVVRTASRASASRKPWDPIRASLPSTMRTWISAS